MPTLNPTDLGEDFLRRVPMARTMGLVVDEALPTKAVVRLPDQDKFHNHLGGPQAGAIFTLGEAASGIIVLAAFGDQLERAVPLAVQAQIAYRRVAMGEITATADMPYSASEVTAQLDAGLRPEFEVPVVITREDGSVIAEMVTLWTLRPKDTTPAV
ncbi:MAG: DUF4442 domain-containing protein [Dermatophilaceae bacterium]